MYFNIIFMFLMFLITYQSYLIVLCQDSTYGHLSECPEIDKNPVFIQKKVTTKSDYIQNPGFPRYKECKQYHWHLYTQNPHQDIISYRWCIIDIEKQDDCAYDYVKTSAENWRKRCGLQFVHEFLSAKGTMKITFRSDEMETRSGFQMAFCLGGSCIPKCPDEIIVGKGFQTVVTSPNFPASYPIMFDKCWSYRTIYSDHNLRFSYRFCALDIEDSIQCRYDLVRINDGNLLCGKHDTPIRHVSGDTLAVCFHSDMREVRSGFYLQICLSDANTDCIQTCPDHYGNKQPRRKVLRPHGVVGAIVSETEFEDYKYVQHQVELEKARKQHQTAVGVKTHVNTNTQVTNVALPDTAGAEKSVYSEDYEAQKTGSVTNTNSNVVLGQDGLDNPNNQLSSSQKNSVSVYKTITGVSGKEGAGSVSLTGFSQADKEFGSYTDVGSKRTQVDADSVKQADTNSINKVQSKSRTDSIGQVNPKSVGNRKYSEVEKGFVSQPISGADRESIRKIGSVSESENYRVKGKESSSNVAGKPETYHGTNTVEKPGVQSSSSVAAKSETHKVVNTQDDPGLGISKTTFTSIDVKSDNYNRINTLKDPGMESRQTSSAKAEIRKGTNSQDDSVSQGVNVVPKPEYYNMINNPKNPGSEISRTSQSEIHKGTLPREDPGLEGRDVTFNNVGAKSENHNRINTQKKPELIRGQTSSAQSEVYKGTDTRENLGLEGRDTSFNNVGAKPENHNRINTQKKPELKRGQTSSAQSEIHKGTDSHEDPGLEGRDAIFNNVGAKPENRNRINTQKKPELISAQTSSAQSEVHKGTNIQEDPGLKVSKLSSQQTEFPNEVQKKEDSYSGTNNQADKQSVSNVDVRGKMKIVSKAKTVSLSPRDGGLEGGANEPKDKSVSSHSDNTSGQASGAEVTGGIPSIKQTDNIGHQEGGVSTNKEARIEDKQENDVVQYTDETHSKAATRQVEKPNAVPVVGHSQLYGHNTGDKRVKAASTSNIHTTNMDSQDTGLKAAIRESNMGQSQSGNDAKQQGGVVVNPHAKYFNAHSYQTRTRISVQGESDDETIGPRTGQLAEKDTAEKDTSNRVDFENKQKATHRRHKFVQTSNTNPNYKLDETQKIKSTIADKTMKPKKKTGAAVSGSLASTNEEQEKPVIRKADPRKVGQDNGVASQKQMKDTETDGSLVRKQNQMSSSESGEDDTAAVSLVSTSAANTTGTVKTQAPTGHCNQTRPHPTDGSIALSALANINMSDEEMAAFLQRQAELTVCYYVKERLQENLKGAPSTFKQLLMVVFAKQLERCNINTTSQISVFRQYMYKLAFAASQKSK